MSAEWVSLYVKARAGHRLKERLGALSEKHGMPVGDVMEALVAMGEEAPRLSKSGDKQKDGSADRIALLEERIKDLRGRVKALEGAVFEG